MNNPWLIYSQPHSVYHIPDKIIIPKSDTIIQLQELCEHYRNIDQHTGTGCLFSVHLLYIH